MTIRAGIYIFLKYPDVSTSLQMVPVSVHDGPDLVQGSVVIPVNAAAPKAAVPPKVLPGPIPSGHIPKPVILPDYIA